MINFTGWTKYMTWLYPVDTINSKEPAIKTMCPIKAAATL